MVINIIFVLAVTLTFLGLIYCYHILIATSLLSALLYFSLKRESIKTVTINFLILFSSIFLIELYFFTCAAIKGRGNKDIFTIIDRNTKEEINNSKSYTTTVFDELGYQPIANSIINRKKIKRGKLVFDANYTIDNNHLRITRTTNYKDSANEILFMGCSFTYGTGLQDNQSLPYVFNLKTKDKFNVYNFGFSNYGAHQMLAILENDIEKKSLTNNKVKYVFYQAILDHINRVTFTLKPKYALNNENELVFIRDYAAQIKNNKSSTDLFLEHIEKHSKSKIINALISQFNQDRRIANHKLNDNDRDLFLQIVNKSKNLVKKKYNAEFRVILWDLTKDNNKLKAEDEYNLKYIIDGFQRLGIKYILISDILSDYKNDSEKYTINGDGHPSALANEKIADYLVKYIEPKNSSN